MIPEAIAGHVSDAVPFSLIKWLSNPQHVIHLFSSGLLVGNANKTFFVSLTFSSLRTPVSNPFKILHGDDISYDFSLLYSLRRCLRSSNWRETLHPSHRKPSGATHTSPCHVDIVLPSRPQAWNNLTPTWKPCLPRTVDKSRTNARFRDLSSRSQGHPQVCYWTHLFIFLFDSRFWIETGVQTSFRRVP